MFIVITIIWSWSRFVRTKKSSEKYPIYKVTILSDGHTQCPVETLETPNASENEKSLSLLKLDDKKQAELSVLLRLK